MMRTQPLAVHRPSPQRLGYAALAAVLVAVVVLTVVARGTGLWQAMVFVVLPDVAVLYGLAPGLERGQLHPRAVVPYNALHRFAGPVLLGVAAPWLGSPWTVAALAWAAHVAFDRAIGLSLRDRSGFQRMPDGSGAAPGPTGAPCAECTSSRISSAASSSDRIRQLP